MIGARHATLVPLGVGVRTFGDARLDREPAVEGEREVALDARPRGLRSVRIGHAELRECAAVGGVRGGRHHVEAVHGEHSRDFAEEAGTVVGGDGQQLAVGDDARAARREQLAVRCSRELGQPRLGDLAAGHQRLDALDEQRHELGLRRSPGGRPRRARVGLGQGTEQVQCLDRRHALGDALDRRRVVEVAAERDLRQQQVVGDQLDQHVDVGSGVAQTRAEPACDLDAGVGVVAGAALAEVVEERAQHEQVGAGHGCGPRRRDRGGFEEVPVDGEAVVGVALRSRSHRLPLGEDPRPHAAVVESLDHRDRVGAGEQQSDEELAGAGRPRFGQRGCVVGEPFERRAVDHRRVLGRVPRRTERELGIVGGRRVRGQVYLTVAHHHAGTERAIAPRDPAERSAQRRPDPAPRVVTRPCDRVRGGGDPGHERVAVGEPQRRRDRVLLLDREHVAHPARAPLQLHSRVEQGRVRGRQARLVVLEQDAARGLRPVQRVHVSEAAAPFLEVGLEHERDLAGLRVPRLDALAERFEPALGALLPLPTRRGREIARERGVAGNVARAQQRGRRVEIVCLRSRALRAACTRCDRA